MTERDVVGEGSRYSVHRWHDGHVPKIEKVRWLPDTVTIDDLCIFAEALTDIADEAADHSVTSVSIAHLVEEMFNHVNVPPAERRTEGSE